MNRNANRTPLLVLGGTTEGYGLAEALVGRGWPVISSFAGRTKTPRAPVGDLRVGGFGGPDGLAAYLRQMDIRAVIDATHPFASRMGWNARDACAAVGIPLLRLERPVWRAGPGDLWTDVTDWDEAVDLMDGSAKRVFLALGRQDLVPFTRLKGVRVLIRSVDRPDPMPPFDLVEVLLARGPFSYDEERRLLETHRIDTLVCKNSGGTATDAKLAAARDLGLRVMMRKRPQRPLVPTVADLTAALDWVASLTG